jgi:hypothetical protein
MTQKHVAEREHELRLAMLASDIEKLDAIIDPSLIFVLADGTVVNKQADLDAHRSGDMRISRLEPSDERIVVHDSSAVVTVLMSAAGSFGGVAFEGHFRYLRFWRRTSVGWRVVGGSVAALPEEAG